MTEQTTTTTTYLTRSTHEPTWVIVTNAPDDISSVVLDADYEDEASAVAEATERMGYEPTWLSTAVGGFSSSEMQDYGRWEF